MTTVLGIDHFFYVANGSYDLLAEKALPHYHDAHHALIASITLDRNAPLRGLDLGIGSGVTTAYLLENFPNATAVGVDLFDEMLSSAKPRLSRFGTRVELVRSDNAAFLRSTSERFDLVVSAFCIHHLTADEKRALFHLIHERLRDGGLFVMLDITTFRDGELARVARSRTIAHMETYITDEQRRREWRHHWNEINLPDPADSMVQWLSDAGFRTETVFRDFEIAVIRALKG